MIEIEQKDAKIKELKKKLMQMDFAYKYLSKELENIRSFSKILTNS